MTGSGSSIGARRASLVARRGVHPWASFANGSRRGWNRALPDYCGRGGRMSGCVARGRPITREGSGSTRAPYSSPPSGSDAPRRDARRGIRPWASLAGGSATFPAWGRRPNHEAGEQAPSDGHVTTTAANHSGGSEPVFAIGAGPRHGPPLMNRARPNREMRAHTRLGSERSGPVTDLS